MRALILISTLSLLAASNIFAQAAASSSTPNPVTPAATAAVQKFVQGVNAADNGTSSTQQIEKTVHQYLIKKPEIVVEALQAYQQKQMESMQQLFKDTQKLAPQYVDLLFHQNVDPMGGNSNGKVTLVEFSDYQCSHCIETSPIVVSLMKANPNLLVVVKEFPIRGPVSDTAARAALAANKQGKYWPFREALFKNGAALTENKIYEIATSVGLNVEQLKKDMADPAIRKTVESTQNLAKNLKLVGTPAFFVAKSDIKPGAPSNSINYVPGIASEQQLQTIIDQTSKK